MPRAKHRKDQKKKSRARTQRIQGQQKNMQAKMQEMFTQLGTPADRKKEMAFPNTGDHVIASSITSNDWQGVLFQTIDFLEHVAKVPANAAYQSRVAEMTEATRLLDSIRTTK